MESDLPWHAIRDLLRKVECDSRSLETLGLEAIDDLISDLDEISDLIQSFERVVKSKRNALSAISRLPNETLCMVFSKLKFHHLLSGMHHP